MMYIMSYTRLLYDVLRVMQLPKPIYPDLAASHHRPPLCLQGTQDTVQDITVAPVLYKHPATAGTVVGENGGRRDMDGLRGGGHV